ncbi:MAG: SH3 domain-containing protein [Burkholderiales bacterium]
MQGRAAAVVLAAVAVASPAPANAADFRVTAEAATVLYDAPSARAKPQFVYGRDVPVEVLVGVEGWTKVRDVSGTIGWMAARTLVDRRVLQVRVPVADIRVNADDAAPVAFRAAENVLLELAEPAGSVATTAFPGWVKVRHRDGAVGFVRIAQVFGL